MGRNTGQGCSKPHPTSPSALLGTGASLASLALPVPQPTHREEFLIKSQPMQEVLTYIFSPKDVQIKALGQGNGV